MKPPTPQEVKNDFLIFWAKYYRKQGKSEAERWWLKYRPDLSEVMAALELQYQEKKWLLSKGKFATEWPQGKTYIHNKRWEDGLHPDFEKHLKYEKERPLREKRAREKRNQNTRNEYQDYLEAKTTKSLLDIKKDGGNLWYNCGWLVEEILTKREMN